MFLGIDRHKGRTFVDALDHFIHTVIMNTKSSTLRLHLVFIHKIFLYNISTLNMNADVDTVTGFLDIPPYVTMVPRCLKP